MYCFILSVDHCVQTVSFTCICLFIAGELNVGVFIWTKYALLYMSFFTKCKICHTLNLTSQGINNTTRCYNLKQYLLITFPNAFRCEFVDILAYRQRHNQSKSNGFIYYSTRTAATSIPSRTRKSKTEAVLQRRSMLSLV